MWYRSEANYLKAIYVPAAVLRGCFFQAEDGIRDLVRSRGLGDVYKRQASRNTFGAAFSVVNVPLTPALALSRVSLAVVV